MEMSQEDTSDFEGRIESLFKKQRKMYFAKSIMASAHSIMNLVEDLNPDDLDDEEARGLHDVIEGLKRILDAYSSEADAA
jgi:hypothetical protein